MIAAILLAAGQATRFGGSRTQTKLAADLNGQPLVRHVAAAALASRADSIGVVTGHAADEVLTALTGLDLFTVHNSAFAEGLSGSLKAGIAALPPDVDGVVVLLADMPLVTGELIDQLIARFEAAASAPEAVIPVRHGRRGNPVLIGRRLFSEIAQLQGDRGATALLKEDGRDILECPIDDVAIEIDVDTQKALEAIRNSLMS